MNSLEDDLRQSLRRQEPSVDLVAKVLERVSSTELSRNALDRRPRPLLGSRNMWLLAACVAIAIATGALLAVEHQQAAPKAVIGDRGTRSVPPAPGVAPGPKTPVPGVAAPVAPKELSPPSTVVAAADRHPRRLALRPYRHEGPAGRENGEATEMKEGEAAKDQLMRALYVASAKVNLAEDRIRQSLFPKSETGR